MKLIFESQFTNLLFLLNGLILLIFFYYRRKKKNRAMKFGNFETLEKVADRRFIQTDDLVLIAQFLAITALIIGISNPVLEQDETISESDYAILLDTSGSMFTSDIEPNRFEAAKSSSQNFVKALPNQSRAGFVAYSGEVEQTVELTSNHRFIDQKISETELGEAAGTSMGNAINSGVELLRDTDRGKTIILLTDGTNNQGIDLEEAAQQASNQNISIYAIGIGEEGNQTEEYGLLQGENVSKSVSPNLDPEKLSMLAEETSGNVSIATSSEDLDQAFLSLESEKVRTDLSYIFIILSAVLLVVEWALKATDIEVIP